MNQTHQQIGLAARLQLQAAEQAREAQQQADDRMEIAQAWDATGFDGPQPWLLSAGGCYGDRGTLHFKALGPDELVALMRAFPAVPRISYVDGPRYFVPAERRPPPEGVAVEQLDGYEIEVSGGKGYTTLRAGWSALLGDQQVHFWVDIRPVSYLHPRAARRAVTHGGSFVRYEGPSELVWPDQAGGLHRELAVRAVSYWKSDDCAGNYRLRGTQMLQLAEAWEAEANRRGEQTRAAFLQAYGNVEFWVDKEELAAQIERLRPGYEARRGGLRCGTLEQEAALETPHALRDRQVAEAHWVAYAAHHKIASDRPYFDHHAWACSYLRRQDLYEVPVTEAMREQATGGIPADVVTYRYGSRWL
jgi:hypothetical protein